MIMLHAMASIHPVDPVRNGTALAIIKATLRAQAYSAIVRAVPVAPRAAAIENPRLMIALIVVIDAQKTNGTVIRKSLDLDGLDQISRKSHSLPITLRRARRAGC
jgi:hypothetical protein